MLNGRGPIHTADIVLDQHLLAPGRLDRPIAWIRLVVEIADDIAPDNHLPQRVLGSERAVAKRADSEVVPVIRLEGLHA